MSQQYSPQFLKIKAELDKKFPNAFRQSTGKSDSRRIPTGYFQTDRRLGGGLPVNRIVLIYGYKACFKTTTALKTIANWQKRCGLCLAYKEACQCPPLEEEEIRPHIAVFIDAEHALDEGHAARIGVDPEHFYLLRPPHGEAACEYAERLAVVPEVGAIVVDSLASLAPQAEMTAGYMDSVARGIRAKLIARMYRAMITNIDSIKFPRLCIMLNHMLPDQEGKGYILPGGNTQKNLASVVLRSTATNKAENRLKISREGEEQTQEYGKKAEKKLEPRKQDLSVLIEHSKISPENVVVEFSIFLEEDEGFRFGDSDDTKAVFLSGQRLGWIYADESKRWVDRLSGFVYKTQKELFAYWSTNPMAYDALKMKLIQGDAYKEE